MSMLGHSGWEFLNLKTFHWDLFGEKVILTYQVGQQAVCNPCLLESWAFPIGVIQKFIWFLNLLITFFTFLISLICWKFCEFYFLMKSPWAEATTTLLSRRDLVILRTLRYQPQIFTFSICLMQKGNQVQHASVHCLFPMLFLSPPNLAYHCYTKTYSSGIMCKSCANCCRSYISESVHVLK